MEKKVVGNRIRDLRAEQNLTLENVVAGVNLLTGEQISKGMVSNWENGRYTPTLTYAVALAKYFGVSLDYIIGRTDIKEPAIKAGLDLSDRSAHVVAARLRDPRLTSALEMYFELEDDQKQQVLDMIEFLRKKPRKKS